MWIWLRYLVYSVITLPYMGHRASCVKIMEVDVPRSRFYLDILLFETISPFDPVFYLVIQRRVRDIA